MSRLAWLVAGMACVGSVAAQDGNLTASASGDVRRAGSAVYPSGARLSDVALAANVDPGAYMAGAAWLRPSLREEQVRLKAGVVFELGVIRMGAISDGHEDLALAAAAFQSWVSSLPVTGRRTSVVLDPDVLEVSPPDNWPVSEGDALFYPRRPADVRIVGAVVAPCRVAQVGLQDARRYLAACPRSPAADPDRVFIIQPDGTVFAQNIAAWNRDPPRVLAPGAWIYVPFNRNAIGASTDGRFNEDAAAFISTQLLDTEGAH